MPVIRITAKPVCGIVPSNGKRNAKEEIGKRITCTGRAGGVLRDTAIECPLTLVNAAVCEERNPVTELHAELPDVPALDPRYAVAEFCRFQVLRLRPLIKRGSAERSVPTPGKVGKRSRDTRSMTCVFKARNAGLHVEVCALKIRLQIYKIGQVAEPGLLD